MVTTHKSQYPPNASTPGITRLWSAGVLTTVSLYSQHNLPSPPQRKGAAGGKLLIKTTHLSNSPLSIGRIVESFHDGYTMGETVIGPFGWREYVLHDMEHTSTVGKVSERECRDLPRYLSLATGGVEAWVGVRAAGGGDGVLMVSGAEKGVGVLAAQIARAMGWKVWGVAKGVEGVAVAKDTGSCERVWELQDLEWRREMEMVNVVLACSGDKEVLRVMKRGAVVVACGDSDVESETKGLLDERDVRLEIVRASELTVEQREEALEKLERLAAEGKMQVVVDVRKGRFEEILEIMKSAGVGELIVEFVG